MHIHRNNETKWVQNSVQVKSQILHQRDAFICINNAQ